MSALGSADFQNRPVVQFNVADSATVGLLGAVPVTIGPEPFGEEIDEGAHFLPHVGRAYSIHVDGSLFPDSCRTGPEAATADLGQLLTIAPQQGVASTGSSYAGQPLPVTTQIQRAWSGFGCREARGSA